MDIISVILGTGICFALFAAAIILAFFFLDIRVKWRRRKESKKIRDPRRGYEGKFLSVSPYVRFRWTSKEINDAFGRAVKKMEKETGRKWYETSPEEPKVSQKTFKQPFYCHWRNGEWDKKFRDKDGNVVE
ncbi:MAG: hypothetical protein NT098_01885 [Candidatus Parcubacteria bacterium]|nr:hypothetical protein [Candidatus Parcubacteria bacterium]